MWSGCDVSSIAPAKNANQNKKIWVAISRVKSQVCWGIFVCIIENRRCLFVGMQFAKTHEVDISDVIGLLHSSSFHEIHEITFIQYSSGIVKTSQNLIKCPFRALKFHQSSKKVFFRGMWKLIVAIFLVLLKFIYS